MSNDFKSIFELNHLYTLTIPGNGLAREAIDEAASWARNCTAENHETIYRALIDIYHMYDDNSDWAKWMVAKGVYAGTWMKRFAKYVKITYGIYIPPATMGKIGEIVRRGAENETETYWFEIVDRADWTPGNFQESEDSCWWGSYERCRIGMFGDGGLAMLLYRDQAAAEEYSQESGIGRCWIYPQNGSLYLFNAYGKNLVSLARLLSTLTGYMYTPATILIEDGWVNGDRGYELYAQEPKGSATFTFVARICVGCNGDHADLEWGDDRYCSDCYNDLFARCDICEDDFRRSGLYSVEDGYACNSCYSRHYTSCDVCGEGVRDENIISVDGRRYCPECTPDHAECCECGDIVSNPVCIDDKMYCSSCEQEYRHED